jgi:hypothetical protein
MVLHRLGGDEQLVTDLGIGVTPGHELQHLALAIGQTLPVGGLAPKAAELGEDQGGQGRGEDGLTAGGPPQLVP